MKTKEKRQKTTFKIASKAEQVCNIRELNAIRKHYKKNKKEIDALLKRINPDAIFEKVRKIWKQEDKNR